ncbi:MAG: hypothetical protein WC459_01320 [Patescibacteria group bacterium]
MTLKDIGVLPRAAFDKPSKRGNFDIYIHEGQCALLIPLNLYTLIILECNAQNAQTALQYIKSHVGTLSRLLNWPEEDVEKAFVKLFSDLQALLNKTRIPRTRE